MKKKKEPEVREHLNKDRVLGYVIFGGGRGGSAKIWPLYENTVLVKGVDHKGPVTRVFYTYEKGTALNGHYFEDTTGSQLATIAATAIAALEEYNAAKIATQKWLDESKPKTAKFKKQSKAKR